MAEINSKKLGRQIEYIKYLNVHPGAGRRTHKLAMLYFAFDGYVDVECKVDGKVYFFENVMAKTIPEALLAQDKQTLAIIECFAAGLVDMLNAGACAMDVVVPACVGAAMGMEPEEAVRQATAGATISMSIPVPSLTESATLAYRISKNM